MADAFDNIIEGEETAKMLSQYPDDMDFSTLSLDELPDLPNEPARIIIIIIIIIIFFFYFFFFIFFFFLTFLLLASHSAQSGVQKLHEAQV
jgi:hypothetical protein